jgi:hypothetical protein
MSSSALERKRKIERGEFSMSKVRVLAVALAVFAVSGCSVLGTPSDFANQPPPHGLLVAPPTIPAGDPSAKVIVYRDETFAGSANHRWLSFDARWANNRLVKVGP